MLRVVAKRDKYNVRTLIMVNFTDITKEGYYVPDIFSSSER